MTAQLISCGLTPDEHGIKKYVKPVLTVDTIFDHFLRAGKKCAIVSTTGDSISEIAKNLHATESMVKSRISRTLKQLREFLKKEGYDI